MRPAVSGVLVGVLLAGSLATPSAQPAPDFAHAKDLYKSAEGAMTDGRFKDAVRDYGAAYDITKDPVLFYKIGVANEKAGKCDVALIYYGRYLREGHPSEAYVTKAQERVKACGGDSRNRAGSGAPVDATGTVITPNAGSGSASAGSGSAAVPVSTDSGPATPLPPQPVAAEGDHHRGPWILAGTSLALVTVGAVLAYSANSSENDVKDLYVGLDGKPAVYDPATAQRYHDAIDQGRRYEVLSWVAFGAAGAAAVGSALWFAMSHGDHEHDQHARIVPVITPRGGGIAVQF